ncbi:MAG: hypothetical protein JWP75_1854 [Frondihabitans sp.]|nr:hypothetical protein [Frondihabitans sp.]
MALTSSNGFDRATVTPESDVKPLIPVEQQRWATWMKPPSLAEHLFGTDLAVLRAVWPGATGSVLLDLHSAASRNALRHATILITGWGIPPLSDSDLEAAPDLRFILHAGGQASSVVPASAWDRGILVANAGLSNAVPVAEYTVAMIVLANKSALRARQLYRGRRTRIDREETFPESGNTGRVVGVVGASRIGRMVIERLAAFDLSVEVFDPYVPPEEITRLGARSVPLDELLASSDVVTLHPPLNSSTVGMIGREQLALLRDGASLINTSRGAIIDQNALVDELQSGRLTAILDVTEPDVLPSDSPLYDLDNVFLTPHIAGSMGHEIGRVGRQIAGELRRISNGLDPQYLEPRP